MSIQAKLRCPVAGDSADVKRERRSEVRPRAQTVRQCGVGLPEAITGHSLTANKVQFTEPS